MLNRRIVTFALALGLLGGAALILSQSFITPGKYLLVTYAVVVIGSLVALRTEGIEPFGGRFVAAFLAFAVYGGLHYVFVSMTASGEVGALGHLWRVGILGGVGVAVSLASARLAGHSRHMVAAT